MLRPAAKRLEGPDAVAVLPEAEPQEGDQDGRWQLKKRKDKRRGKDMLTNIFTGKKVLFQGDSITDCDRDRTTNDLGPGYPAKVAEVYRCLYPGSGAQFINRGVSGNRSRDLLARYGVAAEVNFHQNQPEHEFLELCLKKGVRLSLGSDSHNLYEVGFFQPHFRFLRELGVAGKLDEVIFR